MGKAEQERSSPWHRELASRSRLGPAVALWNITDFTENRHQTRPLCDQKRTKQKHGHSVIVSEYSQSMNTRQATNLSNSPLGGVTPSDPETLLRSPLGLLPSPPRQGSGSLRFAVLTGNSSLPAGACVSLLMSRTTFPREPRGRGWLCHLTRTLARQWRHPYCGVAVLEGVGLLPALTAVLATEEGPQLGPGSAGKGDRDQWLSSFSARPRS